MKESLENVETVQLKSELKSHVKELVKSIVFLIINFFATSLVLYALWNSCVVTLLNAEHVDFVNSIVITFIVFYLLCTVKHIYKLFL